MREEGKVRVGVGDLSLVPIVCNEDVWNSLVCLSVFVCRFFWALALTCACCAMRHHI